MKLNHTGQWTKAASFLIGMKITNARYMTPKEAKEWGFHFERGLVLHVEGENGSGELVFMRDDEGNGPGAAYWASDETGVSGEMVLPTLSMDD